MGFQPLLATLQDRRQNRTRTANKLSKWLFIGVLCSCRSTPEIQPDPGPYTAPEGITGTSDAYEGSILGGVKKGSTQERPKEPEESEELPMDWQIQLQFVQHYPEPTLESLAAHLQMIAHPGQPSPIQGAPLLAVGAQLAIGSDASTAWDQLSNGSGGRIGSWFQEGGRAHQGQTVHFNWRLIEEVPDPENFLQEWPVRQPVEKHFAFALEFQSGMLQPGFYLEDLGRSRDEEGRTGIPPEGGRPDGPRMQKEWVLPAVQLSSTIQEVLFLLPNPFETVGADVLAVHLRAQPSHTPENQTGKQTDAQTDKGLGDTDPLDPSLPSQHSSADSEAASEVVSGSAAEFSPALSTLEKLQAAATQDSKAPIQIENLRGPLLYLATRAQGALTQDLVLTGSDEQLRGWLSFVPPAEQLDESNWAWALERAAWVSLARLQVKNQLPRESRALLLRLAGEVGQYPSTMEAAALQSADEATFQRRLTAENLLFLDDSNPGARVRAFDWLSMRDVPIPDLDPLGTKEARRAALRAFETAQAEGEEKQ